MALFHSFLWQYNAFIKYDPFSEPCIFPENLEPKEFESIVRQAIASYKRRKLTLVEISGAIVKIAVMSKSGKSEWRFSLCFNYRGNLRSLYHIRSEIYNLRANVCDERVSTHVGDFMASEICKLLS